MACVPEVSQCKREASEGKFADIISVKGDVLRYNIDSLQRVDLVIKHGRRYK